MKRETLDLSLKKESSLLASSAAMTLHGLQGIRPAKHDLLMKPSPFSTESLLSKPKNPQMPPQHDLVKIAPMSKTSNLGSTSTVTSRGQSPWHTPVTSSHIKDLHANKPAIPVSPVVREKDPASAHLMGLAAGLFSPISSSSTPTSTPVSLPLPPSSYSLATSTSFTHPSLASNPYLALFSQGQKSGGAASGSTSAAAAAAAAAAAYPGAHLMDPATSAYYAALYSQQMYGAAGLAGYGLGAAALRPGLPTAASNPGAAAAAAAGLDPLQAQALQAMLSGRPPPTGAFSGIPGLTGLPGYFPPPPPQRKDP